jgi:hypothetical protein
VLAYYVQGLGFHPQKRKTKKKIGIMINFITTFFKLWEENKKSLNLLAVIYGLSWHRGWTL